MLSIRPNNIYIPEQTINWDKHHITGVDLQPEIVESKFSLWDRAVRENWLDKEDKQKQALKLLQDPTIYEYAFYKDDDGKPFKYTAYQDIIAQCAVKHDFTPDNPNRYILYRAANQMGKSRLLIGLAKYLALNEENKNIVIISKSLPQAQFVLAELRKSLNNSSFADTWRQDIGETANTTQLTFERKIKQESGYEKTIINRIICAPAGEGALGYPIHYLFLDEADFYENAKTIFWKVLFARTKKTKGQIILFSNPNPDINRTESLLAELWDGDLFTRKFHFNFLDAPWNTIEEFQRDQRNSPEHIFSSTHLGEWSDLSGSFFTQKQITQMLDNDFQNQLPAYEKGTTVRIAVDLGKMRDNTVIAIGQEQEPKNELDKYKDLNVNYIEVMPLRTEYDKIVERLQELINHYETRENKVAPIAFDNTGQKTFQDFLRKNKVPATPIDFAAKKTNKTQLYNDFLLLAQKNKIKIVKAPMVEKQLSGLMFKETANKKFKVENKSDDYHDDIPDAIAMLIHISVTPSKIAPTATFIYTNNLSKEEKEEKRDEQINKLHSQQIKNTIQHRKKYGKFLP